MLEHGLQQPGCLVAQAARARFLPSIDFWEGALQQTNKDNIR